MPAFGRATRIALSEMAKKPWQFHPGAKYLFNSTPSSLTMLEELKSMIGEVGILFVESGDLRSIFNAPNYKALADTYGAAEWQALGKALSQGVELSLEKAKKAMAFTEFGNESATVDPDDPAFGDYLKHCRDLADQMEKAYVAVAKDDGDKNKLLKKTIAAAKAFSSKGIVVGDICVEGGGPATGGAEGATSSA